ncbi:3-octaprenyl-4-hydroxybenzoate carboxy-lyase [Rhodobacter sp. TJ_12]|uniref:UbiD family decarboxylase n=1 Tax=Rhodobacter sp. TJ_12 TaxID=2029399 RepID=UPI001CC0423B|nr:UbiD family decarboxylase [Rhodobacter sp. TJ_12]MBZ4021805.1 3-octaprenyl-4-hydroxybenzoate carboxy-lyase [Rhodobacter sp. TJ_12]
MRSLPVFSDLRSFLDWAKGRNELRAIAEPVGVELQMSAVHRAVLEQGGPVLRFDAPVLPGGKRAEIPVVTNLFGTTSRVAAGLGLPLDQVPALGEFLASLKTPEPVEGMRDAISRWPMLKAALSTRVNISKKGPVQEVVLEPGKGLNLEELPVQQLWPGDGGRLFTWPVVVTRPHGSDVNAVMSYNLGIYRAQLHGPESIIMRWLAHRGGAQHHRTWQAAGKPMPVAMVLGADPATLLSAALPLPENVSELTFSGVLRGQRSHLVPCKTVPLMVPANAEMVIEGWITEGDTAPEGPFGDHTGYYNAVEPFPVMRVSALTHRKDPIYLSTYTGRPPDEPAIIGEVFNDLALPVIRQQIPEVKDLWLPPAACSYRIAVVQIKKSYPGQARRVMMALWGMLAQFSYTKMVIVVDDDIDPRNWDDIAWAMATRMDPGRDLVVLDRTPMDYLDFASPLEGLAGKLGIDATTKIGTETTREWGTVMKMRPEDEAFAEAVLKRQFPGGVK